MNTHEALRKSSALEEISFNLDRQALALQTAGLVYAASLVMRAADNVASEAAWIWESRNAS